MASQYHKLLFNPACPCIKVPEDPPPRPGRYWENSGVVNDDATPANQHGALSSVAFIFPNARIWRCLMLHILCDGAEFERTLSPRL